MTLAFYIARRFLRSFLIVGGSFWGVILLLETIEKIRSFSDMGIGFARIMLLSILSVPQTIYSIMPLIVAMSAMVMFIGLARSSELVVVRASGQSVMRMLATPVIVSIILGTVTVIIGNPIVSATAKRYETLINRYQAGDVQAASIGEGGVWMRQGMQTSNGEQALIHALRANLDATRLYDVTFLVFAPKQGPIRRIDAEEATLGRNGWELSKVKDWNLAGATNPEREAVRSETLTLPSSLTAERIRDSFGTPSAVPIWKLPSFINSLEDAGFSARRHMMWFQMELALPFIFAAMVLTSAAFTMGHARFGKTGIMALFALGGALAIFFLRNIAQVLGENGQIPLLLAAWAPPVIAMMLATTLILVREEG